MSHKTCNKGHTYTQKLFIILLKNTFTFYFYKFDSPVFYLENLTCNHQICLLTLLMLIHIFLSPVRHGISGILFFNQFSSSWNILDLKPMLNKYLEDKICFNKDNLKVFSPNIISVYTLDSILKFTLVVNSYFIWLIDEHKNIYFKIHYLKWNLTKSIN